MAAASLVPPRTPSGRLAVAEAPEDPFNEQDLAEAFDIVTGEDTAVVPERRHLVALAKAWDEAIDLSAALLGYVGTTTVPRPRKDH